MADNYRNQIIWAASLDRVEVDYTIAIREVSELDAEIEKLQIEIDARRAMANKKVQAFNRALQRSYTNDQLGEAIEKYISDLERKAKDAREVSQKHGPKTWNKFR